MLIKELIKVLSTIDLEAPVFCLDNKDRKTEPTIHIENYLNAEKQEVILY